MEIGPATKKQLAKPTPPKAPREPPTDPPKIPGERPRPRIPLGTPQGSPRDPQGTCGPPKALPSIVQVDQNQESVYSVLGRGSKGSASDPSISLCATSFGLKPWGERPSPFAFVQGWVSMMIVACGPKGPWRRPKDPPSDQKPFEDLRFEPSDPSRNPKWPPRNYPQGFKGRPKLLSDPPATLQGGPWASLGVLGGSLGRPWGSLGTPVLFNDWKNNTNFWLFNGFQSCQDCLHMPIELLQGQSSDLLVPQLLQDPPSLMRSPPLDLQGQPKNHWAPEAPSCPRGRLGPFQRAPEGSNSCSGRCHSNTLPEHFVKSRC